MPVDVAVYVCMEARIGIVFLRRSLAVGSIGIDLHATSSIVLHCCSWRTSNFDPSLSLFHSTFMVAEYLIECRNHLEYVRSLPNPVSKMEAEYHWSHACFSCGCWRFESHIVLIWIFIRDLNDNIYKTNM